MSDFKPDWWEDPAFWIEGVARAGGRVGEACVVKTLFGAYEVTVDHDASQSPRDEARRMPFERVEFQIRKSASCSLCGSQVRPGHAKCAQCGGSEWRGTRVRAVQVPRPEVKESEKIRIVVSEADEDPEMGCGGYLVSLMLLALMCWGFLYAVKTF